MKKNVLGLMTLVILALGTLVGCVRDNPLYGSWSEDSGWGSKIDLTFFSDGRFEFRAVEEFDFIETHSSTLRIDMDGDIFGLDRFTLLRQ